ncbi:MAG: ATP-binding protein [Gemmatimonadota bacterium]
MRSATVVVVATAASLGLTALLQPGSQIYSSMPALCAVLVSAWLGGFSSGVFATVLNTAALPRLVAEAGVGFAPIGSHDLIRLVTFAALALLVSFAGYRLRRARSKAERNATTAAALAEQLRIQTVELNDFFDNAAMPLHWVAQDGTILGANHAELEMMGVAADRYIGRSIREFHIDQEVAQQILLRVSIGETIRNEEVRLRGPDGRIKYARITANAYCRDGRFIHARCFTQDVTAQRLAEDSLVRLKSGLEVLVAERTGELERTARELRSRHEELTRLSRELVTVQEAERRSIARELHDHFGQLLTALSLDLRLIERGLGFPEQRRGQISQCIRSLDEVVHDLHNLAANLRPTTLEHLGLLEALRLYVESVRAQSGLEVQFEASSLAGERLNAETEIAVYRIVQEGLTNAVRHARATRVDVVLSRQAGQIATVIEDDGIGFDVTTALRGGRLGLGGMRERATMLGGVLEIETSPRHGTTLVARLPYVSSISDR